MSSSKTHPNRFSSRGALRLEGPEVSPLPPRNPSGSDPSQVGPAQLAASPMKDLCIKPQQKSHVQAMSSAGFTLICLRSH